MPEPRNAAVTAESVWRTIEKGNFAVLGYVTPTGRPRASGVMYAATDGVLFVVTAATSWKSRHITDGGEVSVTVPVRRGGLLSLMAPIPPATISFHASVVRHAPGTLPVASLPSKLVRGLPPERRDHATVLELHPVGAFLTYGLGVSLPGMRDPARARGRVAIDAHGRKHAA